MLRCIKKNGPAVVGVVEQISLTGRAPRNDPALFVLAMCAGLGDEITRRYAMLALPRVARIGTPLFTFLKYVEAFRGWGRSLRRGVGEYWYNDKDPEKLAYQVIKYQRREGWSHRDALRLSHPVPRTDKHNAIYRWVTQKDVLPELPDIFLDFIELQRAETPKAAAMIIADSQLPREAVPTHFLREPVVWEALLPSMPMTALIRNLGNMTKLGVLKPLDPKAKHVADRIANQEALRQGRVHPLTILQALVTYRSGGGFRGSGTWDPIPEIVDALDEAFYLAFGNVEPTGKRLLFGIDVSGSMSLFTIGNSCVTAAQAAGALALVTANVEDRYTMMGFSHELKRLPITPKMRLDDVMRVVQDENFGRTDCALPMIYALERGLEVDGFVVLTDNETWAGRIHPTQALRKYREKSGIPAKSVVVGMTATDFSIADPDDGGQMDVVGWDTATPNLISDFLRD